MDVLVYFTKIGYCKIQKFTSQTKYAVGYHMSSHELFKQKFHANFDYKI